MRIIFRHYPSNDEILRFNTDPEKEYFIPEPNEPVCIADNLYQMVTKMCTYDICGNCSLTILVKDPPI